MKEEHEKIHASDKDKWISYVSHQPFHITQTEGDTEEEREDDMAHTCKVTQNGLENFVIINRPTKTGQAQPRWGIVTVTCDVCVCVFSFLFFLVMEGNETRMTAKMTARMTARMNSEDDTCEQTIDRPNEKNKKQNGHSPAS